MKREIIVYGSGCPRCKETMRIIENYVKEQSMDATIKKVTDITAMMRAGILSTPAIAINGTVVAEGQVPTKAKLAVWFK